MSIIRTYGLDGQPIDEAQAQYLWASPERIIGRTDVGKYTVSTVFLVIDHNWSGEGPPVLWETMVFDGEGSGSDPTRYTSREGALAGHAALVAAYQALVERQKREGRA